MCIPIIFVCGEIEVVKPLGVTKYCGNCGAKDGAQLFESYNRFHFCFLPLCKSSDPRQFYRCHNCGALYPAEPPVASQPGAKAAGLLYICTGAAGQGLKAD